MKVYGKGRMRATLATLLFLAAIGLGIAWSATADSRYGWAQAGAIAFLAAGWVTATRRLDKEGKTHKT